MKEMMKENKKGSVLGNAALFKILKSAIQWEGVGALLGKVGETI